MNGKTHMIVGGLTGGIVLAHGIANHTSSFSFSGYEIYPIIITIAGAVGGLAPDVDMDRSTSGKFLHNILHAGLIISAIFLAIMYFTPRTGIEILDRAVGMSVGINRNVPIIFAGFCLLIMVIIGRSKHRGFTHTTIALLIIAVPLIYMLLTKTGFSGADIVVSAQIGFVLGWLSHMVIDTFNYPGTPWLWPIINKHFNIMRVDSGTNEETIFCSIAIIAFVAVYASIIF